MATESKVCAQDLACTLHTVERVPSDNPGTPAQFIPTRFISTNKLGRHDKLLLAFDALVLSETLGLEVVLGKITHGEDFVTLKVKTSVLESEVRSITAKIAALISDKKPPDLVLNRHCPECEFRDSCRQKAVETDDLSLLAGISEAKDALLVIDDFAPQGGVNEISRYHAAADRVFRGAGNHAGRGRLDSNSQLR